MNISIFKYYILSSVAVISPAVRGEMVRPQETVLDFSNATTFGLERVVPAEGFCRIGEAPGTNGRKVIVFDWPQFNGPHVASYVKGEGPIVIDKPGRYKITARLCSEQVGAEVTRLGLRLNDRAQEVYQLFADVLPGEPGWVDVTWVLDTEGNGLSTSDIWGGDQNRKIDLPLRLQGWALPFAKWQTGGGTLWIDRVAVAELE